MKHANSWLIEIIECWYRLGKMPQEHYNNCKAILEGTKNEFDQGQYND